MNLEQICVVGSFNGYCCNHWFLMRSHDRAVKVEESQIRGRGFELWRYLLDKKRANLVIILKNEEIHGYLKTIYKDFVSSNFI